MLIRSKTIQHVCVEEFETLSGWQTLRLNILLFNTDKRTLRSKIWKAGKFEILEILKTELICQM